VGAIWSKNWVDHAQPTIEIWPSGELDVIDST